MTSRFTGSRRAAIVVLVVLGVGGAAWIFTLNRKTIPAPGVTVLDPSLSILLVEMRQGTNTYYLPVRGNVFRRGGQGFGSRVEGKLRDEFRGLGIKLASMPAFQPGTNSRGRAFLVGYAFPDRPWTSIHLVAELAAEGGVVFPLKSVAGGGGGPPERSWDLWTVDSLPAGVTNYALRLKLETNGAALAEIQFREP